ncbi:MAG: SLC13 family permease [Planctomycetota bacterium]|nr:SLC13 family permease [Planctomycetota bacterium]
MPFAVEILSLPSLLAAAETAPLFQQVFLLVLIVGGMALYIGQWLPTETTSVILITALGVSGILDASEVLGGFSSTATITVGAMFVLSSGLVRTGALEFLALQMAEFSRGSPRRLLFLLLVLVPPASAFVNNTPIVVMMVPVVLSLCRRFDIKPSKLLIPLSFFAILGGHCTLLGTSTNILVSDLYRTYAERIGPEEWGGPVELREGGFGIFAFTPMGLVYLSTGAVFLFLFSNRLLPERSSLSGLLHPERKADFVTEVVVPADSPLVGRQVGDVFTGGRIRLLELMKGEEIVLASEAREHVLEPENSLIVEGIPQDIDRFLRDSGADLTSVVEDDVRVPMRTLELMLAEAVILPDSPFEGLTVSELGLNRRFGVKVMAVQRQGRHHRYRIRAMRLHGGDVLLIQADNTGLNALRETEGMLVVEGVDRTVVRPRKAPVAVAILVGVVLLASLNLPFLPVAIVALGGAALMMVTRCLRVDEAFRSLDGSVLLILAATIPLGLALERTHLAEQIVRLVIELFGVGHPRLFLSMFFLLTSLLTAVLSNNAVAVLMVPIALRFAVELNINHEALLMAVCFGASASFFTPIGYQTNIIVMGPGGYTFRDYLKIGVPMTILMWLAATLLIPLFWPL